MSKVITAFNHPWAAVRKAKSNIVRPFVNPPDSRINILEEDWDNLIILDACRFDTFEKFNTIEGDLKQIYSTASHTSEFVKKNITRDFPDVVYISASPQLAGQETRFFKLEHVWETHWDQSRKTVMPEVLTSRAVELAFTHPNKRLVVHYMQPHYPFIGDTGKEIGEHATFGRRVADREAPSVWDMLAAGKVEKELVVKAYEENLQIVLNNVRDLVDSLEGKTVISSDHGNLFRKKISWLPIRIEGHPMRLPHPDLLAVPWFEIPGKTRKEINEGADTRQELEPDADVINKRLKELGYV